METYRDIWQAVLENCKSNTNISETGYNLWVSKLEMKGFEDGKFILNAPSLPVKTIILSTYDEQIRKSFSEIMGFDVLIEYTCDTEIYEGKKMDKEEMLAQEIGSKDMFTFDTFIEGPSNRFAYRASIAVAENPGGRFKTSDVYTLYNPLFIYGKSGLGKTHLLNAICYAVRHKFPEMRYLYVRSEDFVNEFIEALGKKTTDEFREKYRSIDVLLIDDIQFIGGKTQTEEEFFHTFNSLIENGKQIVMTSDRPPKEIQSLTDRLCSRFESGILADVQSPEYETRCAIIKRKAELLDFEIKDEVVSYIAEKIKVNIRQLEGVTKKLHAMSNLGGQSPTIALAQKVIKDVINDDIPPVPVTVERIVDEVSRTEGVSVDDIFGKKQKADIAHARRVAMYMIREITNISYEMIGDRFKRNHSTVMYNINQISDEMGRDSKLARRINDMISNIKDYQ